ncbi:MAG: hypothetical protein ACLVH8_04415 [Fusobacterium sp.]
MKREQIEVLVQICGEKNMTLKQAIENIPDIIKEFPALAEVLGGVK